MKLAIFQWFLSMVGLDMDMVHKYSYTTHMFCNCFTSVYTLECGSAMICSQGGIIDPASHNV